MALPGGRRLGEATPGTLSGILSPACELSPVITHPATTAPHGMHREPEPSSISPQSEGLPYTAKRKAGVGATENPTQHLRALLPRRHK